MASNRPQNSCENMEGETAITPEEQTKIKQHGQIMSHIQDMTQQTKFQILLNVVQLNTEHVQQRNQITMLQSSIKRMMEDRVVIKKNLIDQHNFKHYIETTEEQKQSATVRLRECLESVNAHIKSNDELRLKLRDDDVCVRSAMENVKKQSDELSDIAKCLQRSLEKGLNRMNELNQQLNNLNKENAKLQDDCRVKGAGIKTATANCAEIVQKAKQELVAADEALKSRIEELKREQQKRAEHVKAYSEQQAAKDTLLQDVTNLQKSIESEILNHKQYYAEQEERLKKSCEEMKMEQEQKSVALSHKVQEMMNAKRETEVHIGSLKTKQTNLAKDLETALDRNNALESAINSYDHNKHLDNELAMLKKSVVKPKEQPNLLLQGRRKVHTFVKDGKGLVQPKPTEAAYKEAPPTISITSDSEQSCLLQSSLFFDGKL
uniref:Uncharacterized protein n=1 Tax=Anopheles farauti TaxID=69004 RepID=A0A182QAS0_9DIPT